MASHRLQILLIMILLIFSPITAQGTNGSAAQQFSVSVTGLDLSISSTTDEITLDAERWEITEIGQLPEEGLAYDVYVDGNYAYLADDSAGLEIYDISDPSDPVQVGNFSSKEPLNSSISRLSALKPEKL